MPTDQEYKVQENRVRRALRRQEHALCKSRTRDPRATDYGMYHIVSINNVIVAGGHTHNGYGMTLDEVEAWANAPP